LFLGAGRSSSRRCLPGRELPGQLSEQLCLNVVRERAVVMADENQRLPVLEQLDSSCQRVEAAGEQGHGVRGWRRQDRPLLCVLVLVVLPRQPEDERRRPPVAAQEPESVLDQRRGCAPQVGVADRQRQRQFAGPRIGGVFAERDLVGAEDRAAKAEQVHRDRRGN